MRKLISTILLAVLALFLTGIAGCGIKDKSTGSDNTQPRQAADQPSATWSCKVDGSEMVMDAGLHIYTGTLVADGDDWNYDATATWLDEEGVTWTSHIVVEGTRRDDDTFTPEQAYALIGPYVRRGRPTTRREKKYLSMADVRDPKTKKELRKQQREEES